MEQIGQLNAAIYRNIVGLINHRLRDLPIRSGNHIFLWVIWQQDGITQKEICEMLHMEKSTTAKAIRHLIDLGYVSKKRDESDKRFTRLYLTRAGRQAAPLVEQVVLDIRKALVRGLTAEQTRQAFELMNKMFSNIQQEKQRTGALELASREGE